MSINKQAYTNTSKGFVSMWERPGVQIPEPAWGSFALEIPKKESSLPCKRAWTRVSTVILQTERLPFIRLLFQKTKIQTRPF